MEGTEGAAEALAALGALFSFVVLGVIVVGFVINLLLIIAILRTWKWSYQQVQELREIRVQVESLYPEISQVRRMLSEQIPRANGSR